MTAPRPAATSPPWWLEPAVFLVFLVIAFSFGYRTGRDRASLTGPVGRQLDSLAKAEPKVDTEYVGDTVRFDHFARVVDTLWRKRDTAWLHDTVRVKEYVAAADSAVHACRQLITACDRRHAIDTLEIADWRRLYQAASAKPLFRPPDLQLGYGTAGPIAATTVGFWRLTGLASYDRLGFLGAVTFRVYP